MTLVSGGRVIVIGGGITGRLVQHAIPEAKVFDWGPAPEAGAPKLTRQWGANYLWEPIPGIPCRNFEVITHVDGEPPTAESIQRYKDKIGKGQEDPSRWGLQFAERTRGYDFIELPPCEIAYGLRAIEIYPERRCVQWSNGVMMPYDWLISTIPLFSLLDLLGEEANGLKKMTLGRFMCQAIYVKAMQRPPDARFPPSQLYVNYLSDPAVEPYRYCDRDSERHFESLTNMGTLPNKKLYPGKIHDLPHGILQNIHATLGHWHICCFGRYARWDSDELVHQTWKQISQFAERLK